MTSELPLETTVETYAGLRQAGEAHLLLDVREPWEVALCRIDGSVNIPMNELPGRLAELPDDGPLVVMCRMGGRSFQVVNWLRAQGYDEATSLAGGIDAWAREVDPSVGSY